MKMNADGVHPGASEDGAFVEKDACLEIPDVTAVPGEEWYLVGLLKENAEAVGNRGEEEENEDRGAASKEQAEDGGFRGEV
jgi:hypothetical protein